MVCAEFKMMSSLASSHSEAHGSKRGNARR
jgi:hypothetical protein